MIYILMDQCSELEFGNGETERERQRNRFNKTRYKWWKKIKPMDIKEMTSMNEQRADIFQCNYKYYFFVLLKYSSCWAFVIF